MPEKLRGTYSGFGSDPIINYVKSLGVTSIELLSIHTFVNDSNLLEKKLTNYRGYNTISFLRRTLATRRTCQTASVSSRKWWPGFTEPASR